MKPPSLKNPFKKLDDHAELLGRMAETTGADLSKAALEGKLTPETYRKALRDCTHCKSPEKCLAWLDEKDGAASAPPQHCNNRDLLKTLKG